MQQIYTLLSLLFHDTGKPDARVLKTSETRGEYHQFPGHEHTSARLWEDYAVTHWAELKNMFGLVDDDFYKIGWMIENHLPLRGAKDKTLKKHAEGVVRMLGKDAVAFIDVMTCDQNGRISDGQDVKLAEYEAYRAKFFGMCESTVVEPFDEEAPKLYVLIGASGSGKSTWTDDKAPMDLGYFSLDQERLRFLEEVGREKIADEKKRYARAFDLASKKPRDFEKFADASFLRKVKARNGLIVDNTNTSAKARAKWSNVARNHGFVTVGVLFPIARKTLLSRQLSRADKSVPVNIVLSQYSKVSFPTLGDDVDLVIVETGNMM